MPAARAAPTAGAAGTGKGEEGAAPADGWTHPVAVVAPLVAVGRGAAPADGWTQGRRQGNGRDPRPLPAPARTAPHLNTMRNGTPPTDFTPLSEPSPIPTASPTARRPAMLTICAPAIMRAASSLSTLFPP